MMVIDLYEIVDGLLVGPETTWEEIIGMNQYDSASSHKVSVPRHRLSDFGRRAFAVAGPTVWNSLPEDMCDPDVSEDSYRQSLKTFLFSQY